MEIQNLTVKRINVPVWEGLHILAIHYHDNFYRFQIQHDKFRSVLTMFGGNMAKCDDMETLLYIAQQGYNEHRLEYAAMLETE